MFVPSTQEMLFSCSVLVTLYPALQIRVLSQIPSWFSAQLFWNGSFLPPVNIPVLTWGIPHAWGRDLSHSSLSQSDRDTADIATLTTSVTEAGKNYRKFLPPLSVFIQNVYFKKLHVKFYTGWLPFL